jgi:hypothetical protein
MSSFIYFSETCFCIELGLYWTICEFYSCDDCWSLLTLPELWFMSSLFGIFATRCNLIIILLYLLTLSCYLRYSKVVMFLRRKNIWKRISSLSGKTDRMFITRIVMRNIYFISDSLALFWINSILVNNNSFSFVIVTRHFTWMQIIERYATSAKQISLKNSS